MLVGCVFRVVEVQVGRCVWVGGLGMLGCCGGVWVPRRCSVVVVRALLVVFCPLVVTRRGACGSWYRAWGVPLLVVRVVLPGGCGGSRLRRGVGFRVFVLGVLAWGMWSWRGGRCGVMVPPGVEPGFSSSFLMENRGFSSVSCCSTSTSSRHVCMKKVSCFSSL